MRVNGGKREKRKKRQVGGRSKMKRESFEMQNLSSNYVCPAVIVGIDRCAKQICSRTVIKAGVNEDDLTLYRSSLSCQSDFVRFPFRSFRNVEIKI